MNIAIFAYSRTGCKTARRICMALPEAETLCYAVPRLAEPGFLPLEKAVYGAAFSEMDALIFVGAAGIAVDTTDEPVVTEEPTATTKADGSAYKVAMICDSSINDGGWGAACYNAMIAAAEKMGWESI